MPENHKALEFLKTSHLYRLGHLPTEWPHPKTVHLSDWAKHDLPKGLGVLHNIDLEALSKLGTAITQIGEMGREIKKVLSKGGRVFLGGCGATGRLAMTLEHLWRKQNPGNEQVISFMAGGDVALVQALEGFEDFPDYGRRHLEQLGFTAQDILISCTEGGETPFVIGATAYATQVTAHPTYFLYCNPTKTLSEHVARSREILSTPGVVGIELFVGPMALSGSTRMQASTVLQLAVGLALFAEDQFALDQVLADFIEFVKGCPYEAMAPLTELEAAIYQSQGRVLYIADEFAITVFTDTTERAPTFNLAPLEPEGSPQTKTSLAYVSIPSARTAVDSWFSLLQHGPRSLNWPEIHPRTTSTHLLNFNFGQQARALRQLRIGSAAQTEFVVHSEREQLIMQLGACQVKWKLPSGGALYEHLLLKMLLNAHSTLLMGRLGRYRNNIMTWVTPTNGKLIDRAARYVLHLLAEDRHGGVTYEQVVLALFEQMESMDPSQSLVERTYQVLVEPSEKLRRI